MDIKISDHFTVRKLIIFTSMPIISIVLCSVYTLVDSLFVSNFCRETAFAGMNISAAYTFLFASFGYMIGEGGCALLGKLFGENKNREVKELFSFLVVFSLVLGAVLSIVATCLFDAFLGFQGATGELYSEAKIYGQILICGFPAYILQFALQQFFVAADKPQFGIGFALIAGAVNIALDALFIAGLSMGVAGAAIATVCGQIAGVIAPLIYVIKNQEFSLRFVKFKVAEQWQNLIKVCTNGSSEMLSNVAAQVVCILYNTVLIRIAGVKGVSAYSVLLNVAMIFSCIFMGFDMGVIPIVAYNFGAENTQELKNVKKGCQTVVAVYSLILIVLTNVFANPICSAFVGYDGQMMSMATFGIRCMSVGYLFIGFNLFGSAFFTGLNNGAVSAFLSTVRTFVFPIVCLYALANAFGMDGVWYSLPATEVLSFIVTIAVMAANKKKYSL